MTIRGPSLRSGLLNLDRPPDCTQRVPQIADREYVRLATEIAGLVPPSAPPACDTGRTSFVDAHPGLEPQPRIRPLGDGDVEHVKWALYAAVTWNPRRELPPFELLIGHPELARYHQDWGRPGDLGVVAEIHGDVIGVACGRLFAEDDHGDGYVDERTPELAVAVASGHQAEGIGTRLMAALAAAARDQGAPALSLSVDHDNPAVRLYERLGYRELSRDASGIRMILDL